MEKAKIYTEEIKFCEMLEQAVDVDFLLPDYLPSISSIFKCNVSPKIVSKKIDDGEVVIDGSVTLNVLYRDDNGRINSFIYEYPFQKTKDIGEDIDDASLIVTAKCEYMNIRAVTNRKIDIHGAIGLYVTATTWKSTEIIGDENGETVEALKSSVPYTRLMCVGEKSLNIEEESSVSNLEPVYSVLRYDAAANIKETKAISGKVIVKGEMTVNTVFLGENNSLVKNLLQIPFSQVVEIENDTECAYESNVEIGFLDIKPKTDQKGVITSVNIGAKLLFCVRCLREENLTAVVDAYSIKYDSNTKTKDIGIDKKIKTISEAFTVKKSLHFEDTQISSVLDNFCNVNINDVRINSDKLSVSGVITASFITEDYDKRISYLEKQLDFEYTNNIQSECAKFKCNPKIKLLSCDYTITGEDTVDLRAELSVNGIIYECVQTSVVTDIIVDKDNKKETDKTNAMTIYFASIGERIWDIARKYLASSKEIKEINNIETEVLQNDTMIFIPLK